MSGEPQTVNRMAAGRRRGAGRNLPAAIATGLLLAALLLGTLVLSRPVFLAFVLAVVLLALTELLRALRAAGAAPAAPVALGAAVLLVAGAYLAGYPALTGGFALTVVASLAWYMPAARRREVVRNAALTVLAVAYVPFLAAHLALVLRSSDHPVGALIGYAAVVVIYDTAAYASGVLLGRHPLAPGISPNKSWEGLAGATLLCLAAGAFLLPRWAPWELASGLTLAALACAVAPLGDLVESLLKRDLGVKDMGSILPGHGGMLDRVDALLLTAPVLYYVLLLYGLIR